MTNLPYAEDMNYWKTGKSSPDIWLARAKSEISKAGGVIETEGFGAEWLTGRSAYMLSFRTGISTAFKMIWPVLPTKKKGGEFAARIQAATMLYHAVKNRCIAARVFGMRTAFFAFLVLPSGESAAEVTSEQLMRALPRLLAAKL